MITALILIAIFILVILAAGIFAIGIAGITTFIICIIAFAMLC